MLLPYIMSSRGKYKQISWNELGFHHSPIVYISPEKRNGRKKRNHRKKNKRSNKQTNTSIVHEPKTSLRDDDFVKLMMNNVLTELSMHFEEKDIEMCEKRLDEQEKLLQLCSTMF